VELPRPPSLRCPPCLEDWTERTFQTLGVRVGGAAGKVNRRDDLVAALATRPYGASSSAPAGSRKTSAGFLTRVRPTPPAKTARRISFMSVKRPHERSCSCLPAGHDRHRDRRAEPPARFARFQRAAVVEKVLSSSRRPSLSSDHLRPARSESARGPEHAHLAATILAPWASTRRGHPPRTPLRRTAAACRRLAEIRPRSCASPRTRPASCWPLAGSSCPSRCGHAWRTIAESVGVPGFGWPPSPSPSPDPERSSPISPSATVRRRRVF